MTGVGEILGTAEYMSPEQASGEVVDHRSDIYSLGVVAFYALAGRLPFEGPTVAAVLAKHITQPAPPIAEVCEGVPGRLAQAVDRCLAKNAVERYAKTEELADALGAAIEARRELPVPLRIFIRKSREANRVAAGVLVLEVLNSYPFLAMGFRDAPLTFWVGWFFVWYVVLWTLPVGALLASMRKVIRAGFGREDVAVAWRSELDREREERAVEFGRAPSIVDRALRWTTVAGFGTAAGAGLLTRLGYLGLGGVQTTIMSALAGVLAGTFALLRHERRTDIGGRLMAKLLNSRAGRGMFNLAGLGLNRAAIAAPATHRPTEMAIGMAVDTLFEALPKPTRQQLADLPKVVRGLESDAMHLRRRVDALDDAVAKLGSGKRTGSGKSASDSLMDRRETLDRDLHAARDNAKERLADAVTALEGIRLNLLRLTAGAGKADGLSADLSAAREVSDQVRRLLEGHAEVEAHLSGVAYAGQRAVPSQP